MSRRRDTRRWLERHRRDPYVRAAQSDDYRSRAAYKLAEIDAKSRLLAGKHRIVDLGAAPGSWSQYCRRHRSSARVVALDRLDMAPIPGVEFLQLDFAEQSGLDGLLAALGGEPVDLVLSDMAPNLRGVKTADQAAVIQLAELAFDLCDHILGKHGDLLIKVFQGEGFDTLLHDVRRRFDAVQVKKPDASRDASREMYLLARGWRT